MKFELEDSANEAHPTRELLEDDAVVAKPIGRDTITKSQYW